MLGHGSGAWLCRLSHACLHVGTGHPSGLGFCPPSGWCWQVREGAGCVVAKAPSDRTQERLHWGPVWVHQIPHPASRVWSVVLKLEVNEKCIRFGPETSLCLSLGSVVEVELLPLTQDEFWA